MMPIYGLVPMAVDLFLSILLYSLQYTFMLALEGMSPGGSLSTLLIATPYWQDLARHQLESVLAGGNGDGGTQVEAEQ
jgi:hypothetical protein